MKTQTPRKESIILLKQAKKQSGNIWRLKSFCQKRVEQKLNKESGHMKNENLYTGGSSIF